MTLAWYGHLKFKSFSKLEKLGLLSVILISWGIAFFEYCFQVPANRLGHKNYGGPFDLVEIKVIQEVISISIFAIFTLFAFKEQAFKWNHAAAFLCIILAVYFLFKK